MTTTLRIGTRRSRLARAQSEWVGRALVAIHPNLSYELVPLQTRGDVQAGPLAAAGGKGLFTAELEAALREGRIDVAVHSAKDMPVVQADDLTLVAIPERGDARDALVTQHDSLAALPAGAAIGTGSPRRAAQLLRLESSLRAEAIRGNVETRVARAVGVSADLDAVVLAMAGLQRSGLLDELGSAVLPLDVEQMLPAAGQGTLAVQALAARADVAEWFAAMDCLSARQSLEAERAVVAALEADCHSCLAVLARPMDSGWQLCAFAARPDGSEAVEVCQQATTAAEAAAEAIAQLQAAGARERLRGQ